MIAALVFSCIDPFAPKINSTDSNILVVNGYLDASTGSATIQLSRSTNIADVLSSPAELKATVTISSSGGIIYQFIEQGGGDYLATNIKIDAQQSYTLKILTKDGEQYSSVAEPVKTTPSIDSVSWVVDSFNSAVAIKVNTHDPQNNTRYYQWDFVETWEYQTKYNSSYEYVGNTIVPRTKDISRCYKSATNQAIIVGSSTKLSLDVIRDFQINSISQSSAKLARRYSILVKQHALTREAYEYWSVLKNNSESLGSLYAPIPSQLVGNISNINNKSIPVIGYFSIYSVQEKRIFIKNSQLPKNIISQTGYESCQSNSIDLKDLPLPASYLFLTPIYVPFPPPTIIGYEVVNAGCADCRLAGGSITVPDFWN